MGNHKLIKIFIFSCFHVRQQSLSMRKSVTFFNIRWLAPDTNKARYWYSFEVWHNKTRMSTEVIISLDSPMIVKAWDERFSLSIDVMQYCTLLLHWKLWVNGLVPLATMEVFLILAGSTIISELNNKPSLVMRKFWASTSHAILKSVSCICNRESFHP